MDLTPDGPAPLPRRPLSAPRAASLPVEQRTVLLWGDSERFPNIFYRSNFLAGDPFAVVDDGSTVTVWVNAMEKGRAEKEVRPGVVVRSTSELNASQPLRDAVRSNGADYSSYILAAICEAHGLTQVATDRSFPGLEMNELRSLGVDIAVNKKLYLAERRIKTPQEIAAIAVTQDAAQDAVQRAIDIIASAQIRNGILYHGGRPLTGQDLVTVVEKRLLELGCGAESTICCGSPDSADPHKSTSPVLRAGLPIVLDIFPFHKQTRMWGDMTRTVVRGTPKPEVKRMWDAVLEAQQAGLDAIRPGVTGAEIHTIVCEVLKRHGYGSETDGYRDIQSTARYIHSTGHGVGLQVHEAPGVGAGANVPLKEGDVITIEPGLYDPAWGGIRIEDLVVVTATGHRQLTPLPKIFELDAAAPGTSRPAA